MTSDRNAEKHAAATAALEHIEAGMSVGLGTGSTAEILVRLLADRMKGGLTLTAAVPTSERTEALGRALGLPIAPLDVAPMLDVCIDGADEVDPQLNLIKGGGGALLREKIVASASKKRVIMVDGSKVVPVLGPFGLPVEVIPFAVPVVSRAIEQLGGRPTLRVRDGQPFMTDENNRILDCDFGGIDAPSTLAARLNAIPGVVEHGLFCDMTEVVLIGRGGAVDKRVKEDS